MYHQTPLIEYLFSNRVDTCVLKRLIFFGEKSKVENHICMLPCNLCTKSIYAFSNGKARFDLYAISVQIRSNKTQFCLLKVLNY